MVDLKWVRMLRNTLVAGEHLAADSVVDMPASMADALIQMGKAEQVDVQPVTDHEDAALPDPETPEAATVIGEVPAHPEPQTPERRRKRGI